MGRDRRRTDWLVRIAAFAATGAVITIATAWGSVWHITPRDLFNDELNGRQRPRAGASSLPFKATALDDSRYAAWLIVEHRGTAVIRHRSSWHPRGTGLSVTGHWPEEPPEPLCAPWAPFLHPQWHGTSTTATTVVADTRGWPWPAMCGGVKIPARSSGIPLESSGAEVYSAIVLDRDALADPSRSLFVQILPLRPITSGFLANTAIYGATIGLLWFGTATIRRAVRRRRGQCESCGHLLAGLARCPECGESRGLLVPSPTA